MRRARDLSDNVSVALVTDPAAAHVRHATQHVVNRMLVRINQDSMTQKSKKAKPTRKIDSNMDRTWTGEQIRKWTRQQRLDNRIRF
jgi:hypothetical protein